MPLLRGVARTAVVAGTATAVSGRVSRRQQGRWADQEQQQYEQQQQQAAAQAPPAPASRKTRWRSFGNSASCTSRACSPTRSSRPPRRRSSTDQAPTAVASAGEPGDAMAQQRGGEQHEDRGRESPRVPLEPPAGSRERPLRSLRCHDQHHERN